MTPKKDKKGYLFVCLCDGSKVRKNKKIARLVAEAFISEAPFENAQVDHIDRNRENNSVSNLRWVSCTENCRNTTKNKVLLFNGEEKPLAEWAEIVGIPARTVNRRLVYFGWSIEEALSIPTDGNKKTKRREYGKRNCKN